MRSRKVKTYEFDGTCDGFHLMMDRMFPPGYMWAYVVKFLNEKFQETTIFHGIVYFVETGLILRKGDYYQVEVKE